MFQHLEYLDFRSISYPTSTFLSCSSDGDKIKCLKTRENTFSARSDRKSITKIVLEVELDIRKYSNNTQRELFS